MHMMNDVAVGVDVSKRKPDICIARDGKYKSKSDPESYANPMEKLSILRLNSAAQLRSHAEVVSILWKFRFLV